MTSGKVRAVCVSSRKGTAKRPVEAAIFLENYGIEGDAHAGTWHRQISLLSADKVDEFNAALAEKTEKSRGKAAEASGTGMKNGTVMPGAFGENLLVEGFDFQTLPVGTRFRIGDVLLEMTQVGKACHNACEIRRKMGICIMPTDGVFARVLHSGTVKKGDTVEMIEADPQRPFTAAVITLSDRAAAGIYEDRSGPEAARILEENGYDVAETILLPDEPEKLKAELMRLADQRQVSLVLTSGGTGFSLRDRTPEATLAVADRNAPGIAEAIRVKSLAVTDHAMLSRGVSVIRKRTLIVNLPGSVKAVRESLGFILAALPHGLGILRGTATD